MSEEQPADPLPAEQPTEGKQAARVRRPRRKAAEQTIEESQQEPAAQTAGPAEENRAGQEGWVKRHDHWRDEAAGVRLERDRQNNLHTLYFRDPPPDEAVQLLEVRGWVEDPEAGTHAYSYRISRLRPRESMELAEETAKDVANVVRLTKGLEPRNSFFISQG